MKIVGAKSLGVMPVYDLSVNHEHHSFVHSSGVVLHNCGYVVCDRPVHEFIPLTTISGVKVTQYTANSVESVGGVKYDFLGLNSLKDIGDCIRLLQERRGMKLDKYVPIEGRGNVPRCRIVPAGKELYDIWALPHDQGVLNDVASGQSETVFQFNTSSAKRWLKLFDYEKEPGVKAIDSVEAMSAFTALDRPGPLDAYVGQDKNGNGGHNMLEEYARRARGEEPTDPIPFFNELLPETYGIITYQEQLQKVYQYLTGCTGAEAESFRRLIAKKKMEKVNATYPYFIENASKKVSPEVAEKVWEQIKTFGQYGFNKSVDGDTILTTCSGEHKKLKDFVPGDMVFGVDEDGTMVETEVVALHDHGVLDGYEIEFDDGEKVVCSLDHKFLTKYGMLPLKEILERDIEVLASCQNQKENG